MDQIDKLLSDISKIQAVRDFHREHDQPALMPPEPAERVRDFLAAVAAPVWKDAAVVSYSVPSGHIHQAMMMDTSINLLVFEAIDGSLSQMMADGLFDEAREQAAVLSAEQEVAYQQELLCLRQIVHAFKEISTVLAMAGLNHHKKMWMIGELAHATKHLKSYLKDKWRQ